MTAATRAAIDALVVLLVEWGWDGDELIELVYQAMKEAD